MVLLTIYYRMLGYLKSPILISTIDSTRWNIYATRAPYKLYLMLLLPQLLSITSLKSHKMLVVFLKIQPSLGSIRVKYFETLAELNTPWCKNKVDKRVGTNIASFRFNASFRHDRRKRSGARPTRGEIQG